MLVIKVLGTGCPKCKQTVDVIQHVIQEQGLEAQVQKVEDLMEIMEYNILSTPAVVINEVVVSKGKVPTQEEVKAFLNQ